MAKWQAEDMQARFNEFLETALKKVPQMVTRRGIQVAVLVPIKEWNRLQMIAGPSLKNLLLDSAAKFESIAPKRSSVRRRKPQLFK